MWRKISHDWIVIDLTKFLNNWLVGMTKQIEKNDIEQNR